MTFHERGRMLKELALHLRKHLDKFYAISYKTGATKADSWVDIEGGIGNLFANASLRRKFPDEIFCIDGESHNLSKEQYFHGHSYTCSEGRSCYPYQRIQFSCLGYVGKSCGESFSWNAGNCKTGNDHFLFNGSGGKRNHCK
jgi:hypothetical protein